MTIALLKTGLLGRDIAKWLSSAGHFRGRQPNPVATSFPRKPIASSYLR
jgi:hypothetical protein